MSKGGAVGRRGRRGRSDLVTCSNCGRRIPRSKAVVYNKTIFYSTDLKTADDVKYMRREKQHYCPSCGKHFKIYEKKKAMMLRKYNR